MSIDAATVSKLAKLSSLTFKEQDVPEVSEKLSSVLGFVGQLQEVDTSDVTALTGVAHMADLPTPEREDVVIDHDNREALLANAPAEEMGFFVVPRVVE